MSKSRLNLRTDGRTDGRTERRTDGQTIFYRTLPAEAGGPIRHYYLVEEMNRNELMSKKA